MTDPFLEDLPHVLKHEGGYVDHPRDPGGATNLGVTIGTARRHGLDVDGDGDVDKNDVRLFTVADVAPVYRSGYWDEVRAGDLPRGLDYVTFDAAVNSGPSRGAKWTQRAVGAAADGRVGPKTIAAARAADTLGAIRKATDFRLGFVQSLKTWSTFGRGWARRIGEVRARGLALAAATPIAAPVGHPPPPPRPNATIVRADAERVEAQAARQNGGAAAAGGGSVITTAPAVDPAGFDWTVLVQFGAGAALVGLAVYLATRARARKAMAEGMRAFADRITPEG